MELSGEDALRLHVMLANGVQAVRIDESAMAVKGLTAAGELTVPLNPNGRADQYLRAVRELLSSQVLGSPGGYPVFLRRWTRMGQARDGHLERLLLLGEPEAVVAVVHAGGLTEELARRAWWAMPDADNARRMLSNGGVAGSAMGPVLAEFLVEFLPFEESPASVAESVALVLQPGLVDDETRLSLWNRGRHKTAYYVGFLRALPDDLPEPAAPHPEWETVRERLAAPLAAANSCAAQLCRTLSPAGQRFLATADAALRRPADQDVAVVLVDAIGAYFRAVRPVGIAPADLPAAIGAPGEWCLGGGAPAGMAALLAEAPELQPMVTAMCALALAGERLLAPLFAGSDAIGSVMRRQIAPVIDPLHQHLARLQGAA